MKHDQEVSQESGLHWFLLDQSSDWLFRKLVIMTTLDIFKLLLLSLCFEGRILRNDIFASEQLSKMLESNSTSPSVEETFNENGRL